MHPMVLSVIGQVVVQLTITIVVALYTEAIEKKTKKDR